MGVVIKVSPQTKAKLEEIKRRNGHSSLDSVIKWLLAKAGES